MHWECDSNFVGVARQLHGNGVGAPFNGAVTTPSPQRLGCMLLGGDAKHNPSSNILGGSGADSPRSLRAGELGTNTKAKLRALLRLVVGFRFFAALKAEDVARLTLHGHRHPCLYRIGIVT